MPTLRPLARHPAWIRPASCIWSADSFASVPYSQTSQSEPPTFITQPTKALRSSRVSQASSSSSSSTTTLAPLSAGPDASEPRRETCPGCGDARRSSGACVPGWKPPSPVPSRRSDRPSADGGRPPHAGAGFRSEASAGPVAFDGGNGGGSAGTAAAPGKPKPGGVPRWRNSLADLKAAWPTGRAGKEEAGAFAARTELPHTLCVVIPGAELFEEDLMSLLSRR
ncbi:uncharacterized protein UV8b_00286 [Ustilaginoidea virens]|uniref:Uncharacterized protein n=1 Tax=Ustilaginoidea virens TaxID=1159556 RepID=A0A1B5L1P7_USTVR|nr:uncharacterized protein UV8b_00286 [Ustilaginoidea virens]QUC16045.1 hypothetical protein UV8b_00286 [Ustilaginoidea virens]GAO16358.1 hypothetical protein UVI_02049860 [Ustilaginoidea virens]